jgi:hypothetical protein
MINKTVSQMKVYLDVIFRANAGALKECIEMSASKITLEQVFEELGYVAKWEAKGEARGKELMALKIAKNMINQGFSFETIVSLTQLDPEKVKALYDQTGTSV